MTERDATATYERYVAAWNDHDPEAVMAEFADGGTLDDPATDGTLRGAEIGEWVEETATAFPDVHYELGRTATNQAGVLFAEWTMRGTHDGPMRGLPPTHRRVEIDAVDVVTVSEEGITSVRGYFDSSEFDEQLGLGFPAVIGQLPKLAAGAVRNAL